MSPRDRKKRAACATKNTWEASPVHVAWWLQEWRMLWYLVGRFVWLDFMIERENCMDPYGASRAIDMFKIRRAKEDRS